MFKFFIYLELEMSYFTGQLCVSFMQTQFRKLLCAELLGFYVIFIIFIFYIFDCNFIVFFVVYLMQSSAEMLTVCLNYIFIISNIINQNVLISKMNF